jgi:hypothetical protein
LVHLQIIVWHPFWFVTITIIINYFFFFHLLFWP